MPLNQIIEEDGCRLLVWQLTESIEELSAFLSHGQLEGMYRFESEKRRLEYLSVRVAFKHLLGHELEIKYRQDGKPYCETGDISITHSRGWVAVGYSSCCRIGIDLEVNKEKIRHLYQRFMGEEEQRMYLGCGELAMLQLVWSAKEALYKIIGIQAVDFSSSLRVLPFTPHSQGAFGAVFLPTGKNYQVKYKYNQTFTLAYCVSE